LRPYIVRCSEVGAAAIVLRHSLPTFVVHGVYVPEAASRQVIEPVAMKAFELWPAGDGGT
jgi:hypothetical protein